jgi:hypothetical protein
MGDVPPLLVRLQERPDEEHRRTGRADETGSRRAYAEELARMRLSAADQQRFAAMRRWLRKDDVNALPPAEQQTLREVLSQSRALETMVDMRSELLATDDFVSFRMQPLRGNAARNKGMALFPRKIGGRYAMIGRQDNENLYLIYSDDLHTWDGGVPILKPEWPWEFVQIGNCGSPIELDEGWLLFTHGVGPVRRYAIGAALLDKTDPTKVIARSPEPLVYPDPSEREGYVPNVVYTCGAIRHGPRIILPYAVSDTFSNFATIKIDALLAAMQPT